MNTSAKSATAVLAAAVMASLIAACGGESATSTTVPPSTTTAPPTTTTSPDQPPALEDGEWFGFVTVDSSGGVIQLLIDPAEILSGQEAHDAAVEAGFITEDQDLPNDFFIANPETQTYLVPVTGDTAITVLSAEAVETELAVDLDQLAAILDGSYEGEMIYGIVPGQPAPFDVTVSGGAASLIAQVYLP